MNWNMRSRWKAIRKVAEQSEVISLDLDKYASPKPRLNPVIHDKKLTMTFDLTLPITPQIDQAETEARWGQRDLDFKMKREKPPMSDEEFEQGLKIVTMHSEGKSFQEIGDIFWPLDTTPQGRKSKANRYYRKTLTAHKTPRLPRPRIRP